MMMMMFVTTTRTAAVGVTCQQKRMQSRPVIVLLVSLGVTTSQHSKGRRESTMPSCWSWTEHTEFDADVAGSAAISNRTEYRYRPLPWPKLRQAFPSLLRANSFVNDDYYITRQGRITKLEPLQIMQKHDIFWASPQNERDEPLLIAFISHKWESPEDPDPTGRQLAAIQFLLE